MGAEDETITSTFQEGRRNKGGMLFLFKTLPQSPVNTLLLHFIGQNFTMCPHLAVRLDFVVFIPGNQGIQLKFKSLLSE